MLNVNRLDSYSANGITLTTGARILPNCSKKAYWQKVFEILSYTLFKK